MTSTFIPFFFSTLALGVRRSASTNCFSQRSILLSTLPAPLGKAKTTSSAGSESPATGGMASWASRIEDLGCSFFQPPGALKLRARALRAWGASSAAWTAAKAPTMEATRPTVRVRLIMLMATGVLAVWLDPPARPLAAGAGESYDAIQSDRARSPEPARNSPTEPLPGVPPLRTLRALGAACAAVALVAVPAQAQKKAPQGAKVLLLTGGERQHHGYRDQALYLAGALEDTGRYEVTLCEDAAILETPAMNKYDLLIVNADRRQPEHKFTLSQQNALLEYVKEGHGYVSIHGADNAPPDWIPEWKEMLGGIYSHVGQPDGKAIMGKYTVKVVDRSSPVTAGLDDFELADELYTNMQMLPDVKPLATIDFKDATWPVAWTWTYGKGKVFHTSLGHRSFKPGSYDPMTNPNLMKLILQGIDYAAGKSDGASAEK